MSKPLGEIGYKKRKFIFWILLAILFCLTNGILLRPIFFRNLDKHGSIRVGICGEVNRPAVYSMEKGSDLAMLIIKAHGTTSKADVPSINLNAILQNDSIYHIGAKRKAAARSLNRKEFPGRQDIKPPKLPAVQGKQGNDSLALPGVKVISVLYVGFPAVFVLIDFYPELDLINMTHIPHSTILLDNNDRLIDLFFTLGISPTSKSLEARLGYKIDYYMLQDKVCFVNMINGLGGVTVNIDKAFAEYYNIKKGESKMDGELAWEFVKFLDKRRITRADKNAKGIDLIRQDNFLIDPGELQQAYIVRQFRQKKVLKAMKKAFMGKSKREQAKVLALMSKELDTNIDLNFFLELYKNILTSSISSYTTLPGYYEKAGGDLYFYPDMPSFKMMKNKEIRTYLKDKGKIKETTIY